MSSPDPSRIVDVLCAYWQTAALTAAIDLGVFTALGGRARSASELARTCQADRAALVRLCDYLVSLGLLRSTNGRYRATVATRLLDARSPESMAALPRFFNAPPVTTGFANLAAIVRSGEPAMRASDAWPAFATSTLALRGLAANEIAAALARRGLGRGRILDVGAGASPLGVELLRRSRTATLVARDRAAVLKAARQHASDQGVEDRITTIAGDVSKDDWAGPFELVLMVNVLDYFDRPAQVRLLRKARRALRPGAALVIAAPMLDPRRRSPPDAIAYDLLLLALGSPARPATWQERRQQLRRAGFSVVARRAEIGIVLARALPSRP
jgi:SAM-dependent methyltransferase